MRSTDKYPTLAEAAKATQKLGFKSQKEYKKNYKQDPRLPSNPQEYYKDEWESWLPYLGQDKPKLYPTFREASDACQSLGILRKTEYASRHYEDPRLPSNPNSIYRKDWKGWPHFLGKKAPVPTGRYKTYEEAKEAARSLGFETRNQYKVSRTLDPRLPLSPERVYAGSWENWGTFLGPEKPSIQPMTKQRIQRVASNSNLKLSTRDALTKTLNFILTPKLSMVGIGKAGKSSWAIRSSD